MNGQQRREWLNSLWPDKLAENHDQIRDCFLVESDNYRKGVDSEYRDNVYQSALYLFMIGDPGDAVLVYDAKMSNIDLGRGMDHQFMLGAGIADTFAHAKSVGRSDMVDYLHGLMDDPDLQEIGDWLKSKTRYFGLAVTDDVAATKDAANAPSSTPDDELRQFYTQLTTLVPRIWATPVLVGLNLAVFIAVTLTGVSLWTPTAESMVPLGANFGPRTLGGEPWRLLSSAFLHFGVIHLAMNMYALGTIGPLMERLLGTKRFSALYLVAAIVGSITSVCSQGTVVSVGASGAVFGVYGGLIGFLLREKTAIPPAALKNLTSSTLGFVGYNLVYGFTKTGIDNYAHVGGLVAGVLCGLLLARPLDSVSEDRKTDVLPVATLLATVLIGIAVTFFVPAPPDFMSHTKAFFEGEALAIGRFNELIEKGKTGHIADDEVAAQLENFVLPTWRKARLALEKPEKWPTEQQAMLEKLLKYASLREQGWTAFASALRAHDAEAAAVAQRPQQEADTLLKTLNEK